jgi:hypothetical protein
MLGTGDHGGIEPFFLKTHDFSISRDPVKRRRHEACRSYFVIPCSGGVNRLSTAVAASSDVLCLVNLTKRWNNR